MRVRLLTRRLQPAACVLRESGTRLRPPSPSTLHPSPPQAHQRARLHHLHARADHAAPPGTRRAHLHPHDPPARLAPLCAAGQAAAAEPGTLLADCSSRTSCCQWGACPARGRHSCTHISCPSSPPAPPCRAMPCTTAARSRRGSGLTASATPCLTVRHGLAIAPAQASPSLHFLTLTALAGAPASCRRVGGRLDSGPLQWGRGCRGAVSAQGFGCLCVMHGESAPVWRKCA